MSQKQSLFSEYKNSLKSIEIEEILDLIFYRPLAFLFVKTIYKTNLTPNQITGLALLFGLVADLFLASGNYFSLVIAAIFLIIYDVLDCADGQLARLKRNGTPVGRIIDGVADYIVTIFAYIGIGVGYAASAESPQIWWFLVIAAGLSNAFHAISVDYFRNRFLDNTQERANVLQDGLEEFREEYERLKTMPGKNFQKIIIRLYLRYSSIQSNVGSNQPEKNFNPKKYYSANKIIIHLWTYLGPTTQLTFLIVTSFINRLDIYLWGMIIVGNSYALMLHLLQRKIDHKLKTKES
jgi:hypothetical protein